MRNKLTELNTEVHREIVSFCLRQPLPVLTFVQVDFAPSFVP